LIDPSEALNLADVELLDPPASITDLEEAVLAIKPFCKGEICLTAILACEEIMICNVRCWFWLKAHPSERLKIHIISGLH
jgi:hypothetical protein